MRTPITRLCLLCHLLMTLHLIFFMFMLDVGYFSKCNFSELEYNHHHYHLLGDLVVQRVRHLGLRSVGRGFKSCSRQCSVTTLGKLFTPMCLCHQAV